MDSLSRVLSLCERDRSLQQELRSLYDGLWNGFLTLKFRHIIDPVVQKHLKYLTEVDCDNRINDCITIACTFFNEVCAAVENHYDVEILEAELKDDGQLRVKLEDEKLSEMSVLQVKYEREPHELVRLMQMCLSLEVKLLARVDGTSDKSEHQPLLPRKRPSLEAALDTSRKLRRMAAQEEAAAAGSSASMAKLAAEVTAQHASLMERLAARESIINSPTCGSECDQLSRELSYLLDSLLMLHQHCQQQQQVNAAEMAGQLLSRSLVILEQDDQVIKQRKANYCLTLRYLASEYLDPDTLYDFKVGVLSEDPQHDPAGKTTRHCSDLSGRIELKYSFPQLPPGRGRGRDVCGQKQALQVYAAMSSPRFNLPDLRASALSLPVVFVTHDQQKAAAYATVCYDSLFQGGFDKRDGFRVEPAVGLERALGMLDNLARRQLMRPLSEMQLDYFRRKLRALVGPAGSEVSFEQLAKQKLGELNRSLWEFYYGCVRTVKCHCQRMWRDGLVLGFVEKAAAERLVLADNRPGVFLIRFSESTGRLSVTRRLASKGPAESLDPFTDRELQAAPLADRLLADGGLMWLVDCRGGQAVAKAVAMRDHAEGTGGGAGPAAGYVARRQSMGGGGGGFLDAAELG